MSESGLPPYRLKFRAAATSAAVACATAAAAVIPSAAQSPTKDVRVSDIVSCRACSINAVKMVSLGAADGPGIVLGVPFYASVLDSRGRYWIAPEQGPVWDLRIYTRDGRALGRVGGRGAGPGELRNVTGLVSVGDSVFVVDAGNGRVSVYDSDLRVVRSYRIHHEAMFPVHVGGGRLVVNGRIRTPELAGLPLHLIGPDGTLIRSFGSRTGEYRSDLPRQLLRKNGPSNTPGTLWSARETQYVIERWDTTGNLLLRLVRDAAWFRPYARWQFATPQRPPSPFVSAVREDANGLLWVAVAVAAPDYARRLGERRHFEGGEYYDFEPAEIYDTMVEVMDPNRGRVVARSRVDAMIVSWTADGEALAYRLADDGTPYIDIYRIGLFATRQGR